MKRKIIILAVSIIIIVFLALLLIRGNKPSKGSPNSTPSAQNQTVSEKDRPQIVSTKPDPLDETIIPTDQIIEIIFNKSLQNAPEFKVKIEPKVDFKVELTSDRKTAKIIPVKPYELGASYTLYIGQDTKFDGVGEWKMDKTFRFRTIRYRGI